MCFSTSPIQPWPMLKSQRHTLQCAQVSVSTTPRNDRILNCVLSTILLQNFSLFRFYRRWLRLWIVYVRIWHFSLISNAKIKNINNGFDPHCMHATGWEHCRSCMHACMQYESQPRSDQDVYSNIGHMFTFIKILRRHRLHAKLGQESLYKAEFHHFRSGWRKTGYEVGKFRQKRERWHLCYCQCQ